VSTYTALLDADKSAVVPKVAVLAKAKPPSIDVVLVASNAAVAGYIP
jgi:hypothetical protein